MKIDVTPRELTLIRVACLLRLDELRIKMRAEHILRRDLQALSKSYDETHSLLMKIGLGKKEDA